MWKNYRWRFFTSYVMKPHLINRNDLRAATGCYRHHCYRSAARYKSNNASYFAPCTLTADLAGIGQLIERYSPIRIRALRILLLLLRRIIHFIIPDNGWNYTILSACLSVCLG